MMPLPLMGLPLHCDESGQGHPLLLIHAYPLDGRLWNRQVEELATVARVLVPDLRGFGRSHRGPPAADLVDFAADLIHLLDERGIDRAIFCGVSMGGYITLAALKQWPERISGVALCNTRAGADSAEGREAREISARRVLEEGLTPIADAMAPRMLSAATLRREPELGAEVRRWMMEQGSEGVATALRAMAGRPDRTPLLESLRVPAVVVAGEEDSLIAREEGEAMARAIPGASHHLIPGTAHLSNLERPDLYNSILSTLVQKVSQAPGLRAGS